MKYVKIQHKELGEAEVIASSAKVFEERGWKVVEQLEGGPSSSAPIAQGDQEGTPAHRGGRRRQS